MSDKKVPERYAVEMDMRREGADQDGFTLLGKRSAAICLVRMGEQVDFVPHIGENTTEEMKLYLSALFYVISNEERLTEIMGWYAQSLLDAS